MNPAQGGPYHLGRELYGLTSLPKSLTRHHQLVPTQLPHDSCPQTHLKDKGVKVLNIKLPEPQVPYQSLHLGFEACPGKQPPANPGT